MRMEPTDQHERDDTYDEFALEKQPMSSAQFMDLLKSAPMSPNHPMLDHTDTPHPFQISSPTKELEERPGPPPMNPPSPFNSTTSTSASGRPPRSIYNRQRNTQKVNSPSNTLPSSQSPSSDEAGPSHSPKQMEPPSPFKRLAVDPASPQKDNESEDSDNYDINDLVLTPTPVKKESNERRAKALPDDDDEGEPMLPSLSLSRISEGKSGNSTQSIDENVIEGKTIVEPGYAPSSITFEPSPRASTTRWVKLRLISLLTRPFRTNKIETKTRSFSGDSNVSSRASLGSLDFEADVDNSNAANSSSTSLGLRSIVPGTMRSKTKNKKRKSSLIEIAKMAEQRHKEEFEFEELQNSVGQFRNPMFEAGSSMGNSSMVKSGIYAAKKRLRRHSIVPGDVIKFSKETTETISYETKTQPDVREKPTNIWDWVIDCDSRLYQRFYLLIVFLILAEACVLPYQFVFYEKGGTEPAPYAYKVYHFLVTGFYILDFYVSLHLTFVDKKSEVRMEKE